MMGPATNTPRCPGITCTRRLLTPRDLATGRCAACRDLNNALRRLGWVRAVRT